MAPMRRFAELVQDLDASTATSDKVAAMVRYFAAAPAADAAWATYFLAGGKPHQGVPSALLRSLACREAGIDDWLFEECYQAVGVVAWADDAGNMARASEFNAGNWRRSSLGTGYWSGPVSVAAGSRTAVASWAQPGQSNPNAGTLVARGWR